MVSSSPTSGWFRAGVREVFVRDESARFPGLDGLRALAILLVIGFHGFFFTQYAFEERQQFPEFVEQVPRLLTWVWQGDKGVDVFFVLSGFLMGWMLCGEHARTNQLSWRRFYLRRWGRIYPAYVLALLLYLPSGHNIEYFWANLIPVNNLISLEKIYIPWSWSLTIELQFYLLCPLLVWAMVRSRWGGLAVLGLVVLAVAYRGHTLLEHPEIYQRSVLDLYLTEDREGVLSYMGGLYTNFIARCPPLLCGLLLGYVASTHWETLQRWLKRPGVSEGLGLVALGTLAFIFSFETYVPSEGNPGWSDAAHFRYILLGRPLTGLAIAVLVTLLIASVRLRGLHRLLGHKAWFPVAQVSYSMYLFHPPFLFLSFVLLHGNRPVASLHLGDVFAVIGLGTALCFAFGCLTFVLLERPCQHWVRRRTSATQSTSTTNTPSPRSR
ncbi:MAG: acyltransferase [SAR324 cluster bacterium]|nr:acyltransferase [SAR324 cluster bacterium]